jgi:hypothetical protein
VIRLTADHTFAFVRSNISHTPAISLDCVLKAAGLIEQMGRERLEPRKEKQS